MAKYNPLAEYLGFLMDGYIDTFFDTCEKANYPATYQSFKDALNAAYNSGLSNRSPSGSPKEHSVFTPAARQSDGRQDSLTINS